MLVYMQNMSNARQLLGPRAPPGTSLETLLQKNAKYMDNSIFTVEESMNPEKAKLKGDEPHVEEEYKKLFEQNNNSYKQHTELWGPSDMQLREGMLSVFVRGKDA